MNKQKLQQEIEALQKQLEEKQKALAAMPEKWDPSENERKTNEMLAQHELQKQMRDIELQRMVVSGDEGAGYWYKSELCVKLVINIALCVVGFFVGHVMFS